MGASMLGHPYIYIYIYMYIYYFKDLRSPQCVCVRAHACARLSPAQCPPVRQLDRDQLSAASPCSISGYAYLLIGCVARMCVCVSLSLSLYIYIYIYISYV